MMIILKQEIILSRVKFLTLSSKGKCEINTVVIVPYIETQKKKRTWPIFSYLDLKETFRFEDENYQECDFRSSQKEKQTPEKLALLLIEGVYDLSRPKIIKLSF